MNFTKTSLLPILLLATVLSGCASYGTISNKALEGDTPRSSVYSVQNTIDRTRPGEVTLILAFSGGGSRAAALAYGVLEELRDTRVELEGKPRRLLDEIDAISSVSGGSFTAAYYGLNGEQLFTDFKDVFFRRDIDKELIRSVINPALWFSSRGRTDMAVDIYENSIFKGATFADLKRRSGPMILINATDLAGGVRFSFQQEYFDFLCSDLSTFPVARAVTASSAVPVLFNSVVIENHTGCDAHTEAWLSNAERNAADSQQLRKTVSTMQSYARKSERRYIHLVDGGVTDNLGLRAIHESVEMAGGIKNFITQIDGRPKRRFVVISVNASTVPGMEIEATPKVPSVEQTLNAVTDIQLHHYNAATLDLMRESVKRWSSEMSSSGSHVEGYFVTVDFEAVNEPEKRRFFNQIPTSFSLNGEQVDSLIAAGHELLRANPEYQRFIHDLDGAARPSQVSQVLGHAKTGNTY